MIQALRVVFKGVELVAVGFGAAVISVVEAGGVALTTFIDDFVQKINLAITASNTLLHTSQELIALPSESKFMAGLHDAANAARDKVGAATTAFSNSGNVLLATSARFDGVGGRHRSDQSIE